MPRPVPNSPPPRDDAYEFSLVTGGPLFRFFLRSHLSGGSLELVHRRVVCALALTWLPVLVLAALQGGAWGSPGERAGAAWISFFWDIDAQVRFLVALPVLLLGENLVHSRMRIVVRHFVEREIVAEEELPAFRAHIAAAVRTRNSIALELAMIVLVYTLGVWAWRNQVAISGHSWHSLGAAGGPHQLTPAGYWYAFVSIPLFQFILLRWYSRVLIWAVFLWRVSRLHLCLRPTHPDKSCGLGFLSEGAQCFSPVLFAQGALVAALIAGRYFYEHKPVTEFKTVAAGLTVVFLGIALGPLLVFVPRLVEAKRRGEREYGLLAARYSRDFQSKWIEADAKPAEPLLGSADIQSMADLANSFAVVRQTRTIPFGMDVVVRLAVITVLPMLPLVFTVIPVGELIGHLIKVVL